MEANRILLEKTSKATFTTVTTFSNGIRNECMTQKSCIMKEKHFQKSKPLFFVKDLVYFLNRLYIPLEPF